MTPINIAELWAVHRALIKRGVKYGFGVKAKSMSSSPVNISRIDCSGHFRYALANATSQGLIAPDGSWIQRRWCETQGLPEVPYFAVGSASSDRVFAAFMTSGINGVGKVGHVWLVNSGRTLESYYGNGVGSRDWDTSVLKNKVHKCFELPAVSVHAPPRKDAALILVTKDDAGGKLEYHRLKTVSHKDGENGTNGHFIADKGEVLAVVAGGEGRVPVAEYLQKLGVKKFAEDGNHLDDPIEPRMYLFVDLPK